MSELKANLDRLRYTPQADAPPSRAKWVVLVAVLLVLAAGGLWWARAGSVVEVETVRAAVQQTGRRQAGAPDPDRVGLRRRAPQGRRVGEDPGPALRPARRGRQPRARGRDHRPPRERRLRGQPGARAGPRRERPARRSRPTPRASARPRSNLTEARRQAAVAERLCDRAGRLGRRARRARSRVAAAEAALASAQADHALVALRARAGRGRRAAQRGAARSNTIIRAPFTGTVVRKMAEVGESVAPIPPGVNISTASGRHRRAGRSRHARGRGRRRRVERRAS